MGDPLSIAASCAGLISLSIEVIQIGYNAFQSAKHFDADIKKLTDEVSQLTGLLTTIEPLLTSPAGLASAPLCQEHFDMCTVTLEDIKSLLQKSRPEAGRIVTFPTKRLLWGLRKPELNLAFEKLRDHKTTFILALTSNAS